ncbi:GTP-BINDING PROTEIN [Mycoplasmopsis pulmonis]|uniref:GTPase Obg n=1 Tax=Mycoplasmopsis pulmonis (strain UAB CTIP) TaxID=272635 RepID=OBG_MYCPU|nr:GTPase ObgE [Mycoplasmopsis pulmonis]Q98QK8.1 RecName: Full=GTPase Obg; AltName: Full=GTP-binding protein Obg [Mycoplasmopsis pulmonis UAB CTIP]CAC13526.1 GTP-BINDING PROTEIN [Mycoplasmopsis pulmonis]
MKFIDEITLNVKAGKGGNGMIAFRREAHVDRGGPSGGDGGNGGNIYFVGDLGKNTLLHLYLQKSIVGNNGVNGGRKNLYGAAGEDKFIKVPVGTVVYEGQKVIADIVEEKPYLIAKGGRGGRGNTKFKTAKNKAPRISENGLPGESKKLTLVLKVLADVGFVGKPSAGKSTLLSVISNAKPTIADYDFTTLVPQLGLVKYFDNSFVVADLPGLIKGAHQGKGLGIRFLKHIERCKVIANVIDFGDENKNPLQDYQEIRNELKLYNLNLEEKDEVIVANKKDQECFEKKLEEFSKHYPNKKIIAISALKQENLDKLKEALWQSVKNTKDIVFELSEDEEVFINFEADFNVVHLGEGQYLVEGPKIHHFYQRIPLNTHDNLMRFNLILKKMGVWDELIKQGIQIGDSVKIYDYEFVWGNE